MKTFIYLIITTLLTAGVASAQPAAKKSTHRGRLTSGTAVTLTAPFNNAQVGTNITIPVTVSDTTGLGIIAYQFDLHYDPAVITPQTKAVEVAGTMSSGLSPVYNPITPGVLKVVVFGAYPLTGAGTLFNFKFTAVGPVGTISPITFVDFMFNEGDPAANVTNGQIKIVPDPSTPIPINFSGRESAGGELDRLNNVVRSNTFVMVSDDQLNAKSLTVSFDLQPIDEPGVYKVVNGHWTLMVYEDGVFAGSIYGDVSEGRAYDQVDGTTGDALQRTIRGSFRIQGGMGRYELTAPEPNASGLFTSWTNYADGKRTTAVLSHIL
jgi:hypothetical protein